MKEEHIDVEGLYPDLSPEEKGEAEEYLLAYLSVIERIHDRHEKEGKLEESLLRLEYEKRNNKERRS